VLAKTDVASVIPTKDRTVAQPTQQSFYRRKAIRPEAAEFSYACGSSHAVILHHGCVSPSNMASWESTCWRGEPIVSGAEFSTITPRFDIVIERSTFRGAPFVGPL